MGGKAIVRRTSVPLLIVLSVACAAAGWLVQTALAATGAPLLVPPVTLVLSLFAIGAIVLAFGWPIRQLMRGRRTRAVDPFRATRVVLLAKASSLMGSLVAGVVLGALIYLLTRPVPAGGASAALTVGALVSSVLCVAAGLVVEHWCRLPPDDREPVLDRELEHR